MTASRRDVLSLVLAGGQGTRLLPLTRDRAKPAVPFGGAYRLIDFALSNLVNGGYRRVAVLTQYKSHSLDRHLALAWQLSGLLGDYVAAVPAQMRQGPHWFAGSADAIYQNFNIIDDEAPGYVVVLSADHVYRMDPNQLVEDHIASGAGVTVAAVSVPASEASALGVLTVAAGETRISAFAEKPADPMPLADEHGRVLASMGNYVFTTTFLRAALTADAKDQSSARDIGADVIPAAVKRGEANLYDFARNIVPGQNERERGYWRDVGTLDAYYDANMDLITVEPVFDLYNSDWPIYSLRPQLPPAKFVFEAGERTGRALDALVGPGVIVSGGTVRRSILSAGVHVHSRAVVEDSVLFDDVDVGREAIVRHAVVDKGVMIPAGAQIGVDPYADAMRFTVSGRGVVVIGKRDKV